MTFTPGSSGTTTVKRPSLTSAGRPSTVTADDRGDTLPRTSAVPRRSVDPSAGAGDLQSHVLGRLRRRRVVPAATEHRRARNAGENGRKPEARHAAEANRPALTHARSAR